MEINKELTIYYRDTPSTIKYTFLSPDVCPNCHHAIMPSENTFKKYYHEGKNYAYSVFICNKCHQPYLIWYDLTYRVDREGYSVQSQITAKQLSISPQSFSPKIFPESITNLSPMFVKIYNEALSAENHNLYEICGLGYRKALEFLIKDYLVYKKPDESDSIKKSTLGNCIEHRVDNYNVKEVSKRCAWLGNDQTHYEKKFEDKDVFDLKTVLNITVNWIDTELQTEKILSISPRK